MNNLPHNVKISGLSVYDDANKEIKGITINLASDVAAAYFITRMGGELFYHRSRKEFFAISIGEHDDPVEYWKDLFFDNLEEAANAVVEYARVSFQ